MTAAFFDRVILGNSVKAYLLFAGIIIAGIIFKRILSRLLSKLLYTLFGRFGQEVKAEVFVALLVRPVEIVILLVTLYLAINQLSYPLNEVIFSRMVTVGNKKELYSVTLIDVFDKIFLFCIITSLFWILLRMIDFVAHVFSYKASLTESKSDDQIVLFLRELSKIVTVILCFFVILGSVFNLNVATIIAGLGIGGIAIALAAKESLENLLGSFTIFMDKPFVVGDLIRVEGYEGTVEKVGFRSTQIRTTDKTIVTFPNKKMIDGPLENLTLRNYRRMKFTIGLTYDTAPETIRKIAGDISEYIISRAQISDDPIITFDSFGEWSINIQVLYFIEMMDYGEYMKIKEEINYKIMEIVRSNDASFAYPTRKIIHENADSGNAAAITD
ncbi:mechanosensitive ion channel family protein [Hufsiella ginkgonis]|uniref:Mechanosensitive ion channel n=1 Tax=Hufsiella ginkgonis TaxID=2695274 RepID=A0A7K1XVV1_9SPHI|nr:mechanosensitive ion channel family protein [Hufsiella ginkgonis]MXV14899.1 mechanosensitive ion channel [Hufsiella ginkgonis]